MKIFFQSGAFDELETNDLIWMNDTSHEMNATWTYIDDENNSTELGGSGLFWMNDTSQEKNVTWTYIVEENDNTEIETNDLIGTNFTQDVIHTLYGNVSSTSNEENSTLFGEDSDYDGTYYDELDDSQFWFGQIDDNTSERKRGL